MKTGVRVLYIFFVIAVSAYGYFRPGQTWDVLGYMGVIISYDGHDKKAIHKFAYESLLTSVSPNTYVELTEGNEYRIEVAGHFESFYQQLPIYGMKPLYPFLSYLLTKTSFNIYSSTVAVSILAFCFSCMIIFLWLQKKVQGFPLLVLAVSLVLSANLAHVGRLPTPDSLSGALLLGAVYSFFENRSYLLSSLLCAAAILARPDNIILIFLLLAYLAFAAPSELRLTLRQFVFSATLMIGTIVVLFLLVDHYGWETLFYHAFIENLEYPAERSVQITLSDYAVALARGVRDIVYRIPSSSFPFFVVMSVAALLLHRFNSNRSAAYIHLVFLMLASIVIHFLLFPNAGAIDRFSLAQHCIIGISFSWQLALPPQE